MKAQVETVGKHERSVQVEVPPETVNKELDHVVQDLRRGAKIPGFRPGKAPESVILKMYNDYVQSHAKEHLVSESLSEVLEKESIIPVSEPVLDASTIARGQPFKYTARFEVRPTVEAKDYTGLEIEKEDAKVEESAVDERVETLRQAHATLRGLPDDHVADLGDTILCQYAGTIGENPVQSNSQEETKLELGSKTNLPGLDERLKGVKAGDKRQVTYELAKDLPNKDLAGKAVNLTFDVKSIRRKELPKLDDEFAKDLEGLQVDSLAALKAKIREDLEKDAKAQARQKLGEKAAKKLVEKNPIEVPPSMIEAQSRRMIEQTQRRFAAEGLRMNLSPSDAQDLKDRIRDDAAETVRRDLLLDAVARQEKIEATEEMISERIQEVAKGLQQTPEKVRALYEERGWMETFRHQLRLEKALDFVLEKARLR